MELSAFYRSREWAEFRKVIIAERITDDGFTVCEYCGKPILRPYDIILHHTEPLTADNFEDANVSLNSKKIKILHIKCHNKIHEKLYQRYNAYLVYGAPCSGKTSFVKNNAEPGDLIIDMDDIWQCLSGCDRYVKPPRLASCVFDVRDALLDMVRTRRGKWRAAYIVGGYPLISERERLCRMLGAQEIFIDASEDECIARLHSDPQGRDIAEWTGYIRNWFGICPPT